VWSVFLTPVKKQQALGHVYPCGYCADTTSGEMIVNPPRVRSRAEFALWMCKLHNEVTVFEFLSLPHPASFLASRSKYMKTTCGFERVITLFRLFRAG
jgi:hypothetical protein